MIPTDPGSRSLRSDPGIRFLDPRTCLTVSDATLDLFVCDRHDGHDRPRHICEIFLTMCYLAIRHLKGCQMAYKTIVQAVLFSVQRKKLTDISLPFSGKIETEVTLPRKLATR